MSKPKKNTDLLSNRQFRSFEDNKVHGFIFQNTEYRSIRECCKKLSLSYSKVRRLTRHYKRAQNDPSVAISWALGLERISVNEPKTFLYQDDLIKAYDRQLKFKDKVRNIFMNEF